MEGRGDGPDASSIKPVSSLRSKFENLGKTDSPLPSPAGQWQVSQSPIADERPSTSSGETNSLKPIGHAAPVSDEVLPVSRKRRPDPPVLRPQSIISMSPSQCAPPTVTVHSPRSPPRNLSIDLRLSNVYSPLTTRSKAGSPTKSAHSRTLSRVTTPALKARMSAFLQAVDPSKRSSDEDSSAAPTPKIQPKTEAQSTSKLRPVNRTAKPAVPVKPKSLGKALNGQLSAPDNNAELTDQSVSPFSTPPSSGHSSPGERKESVSTRRCVEADASFAQRIRGGSDASFVQRLRGDSDSSYAERTRAGSNASFVEPSSLNESYFQPSPTHHAVANKRDARTPDLSRAPNISARYRHVHRGEATAAGDVSEHMPRLPTRIELQTRSGRTSPTKPRSGRSSSSKLSQQILSRRSMETLRRSAPVAEHSPTNRIPATKPAVSRLALTQGFGQDVGAAAALPKVAAKVPPEVPAPRRSMDTRRPMPAPQTPPTGHSHDDEEDGTHFTAAIGPKPAPSDFPDSSHANRRPPKYRQRPFHMPTDYDTRLLAVCGEYAVTTGYITKAWSLRTGEELLHMAHGENVKCTAIVFKPSAKAEEEGKRIWLGTSIGEIHEVDIMEQQLIKTKSNAHMRREIIRMYRHASELWTLDDSGELNVWRGDPQDMPNLDSQYSNFRVPRGHSYSIACGDQLWIATGKDIRVFRPGARSDTEFQVLRTPLTQPNTGDVTAGTMISSKPDLVYFGHADGKVSIYNRRDCCCAGVVNVSLYKISSLAGVGDDLWAGYNTGMAYVYDPSTTPWMVKKDWQAHEKQICSIVADQSSVWKLDRLQVVSLGTDNMLRIWDGLLEEDWLDSRMQEHDSKYCNFRELSAAVLTWNAGAVKPGHLLHNKKDNNFFREYLASSKEPPDILVFGFQELVDLEDKKVTAKSFFKGKKKDPGEPEHQGHQYRAWRDYLTRCIDDYMPANQPYSLLHTASMVGLFTCIFVKSAERSRIRHVHTAEVKRGMGGLHGNKGALVVRMVLDDSSVCFLNCHLAAGQTQTIHRNNDVAAILESEALPAYPLPQNSLAQHADVFTSGGDGSMILDHEICILSGDLNYRIDTMGRDTVIKHIAQGNLARLLERDQLRLSKRKNPGFRLRAFQEFPINFAPTYKYNVNTDDYDTSEKRRAPAWCDRILYRGLGKVKLDEYRRWEVRVSDHRPVSGRLKLRVKTVDASKRDAVWDLCLQESEVARKRVAKAVQLDYLTNTLGMTAEEAAAALRN